MRDSVAFIVAPRSRGGTPSPLGRHGPIYRSQHQTVTAASPMSPKVTLGTKRGPRDTHSHAPTPTQCSDLWQSKASLKQCSGIFSQQGSPSTCGLCFKTTPTPASDYLFPPAASRTNPSGYDLWSEPKSFLSTEYVSSCPRAIYARTRRRSIYSVLLHMQQIHRPLCSRSRRLGLVFPAYTQSVNWAPISLAGPAPGRQGRGGPAVRALPVTNRLRKRKSLDVLPSSVIAGAVLAGT